MKKNVQKEETVKQKDNKKRDNYIAEQKTVKKEKRHGENIFKSIPKYFNGVLKEIKRIRWTSTSDLIKYSIASVAFVLIFGLYFYAIDWLVLVVRSLANR